MWILLTRFHSFLLLHSAISSRHLTYYSQDVLSDAGQIETHLTGSLCGYVCGSVHFMSLCECECMHVHLCL